MGCQGIVGGGGQIGRGRTCTLRKNGSISPTWPSLAPLLDAHAGCCGEGVLFCPGNSADDRYPASDIKTMTSAEHFDDCFKNRHDRESKFGEILIPGQVPVDSFRGLLFCDREAMDY